MSFILSDSVGIRGVNHSWDVMFVQDALNRVPPPEGGPGVPLVLDGLCGPKTRRAIQGFQLHHFGWGGADGLVEVERRTHHKLREYWEPAARPEKPPPPALPVEPKSTRFIIIQPHGNEMMGTDRRDWFFEIRSAPFNRSARYWLGTDPRLAPGPAPTRFNGWSSIFDLRRARTTHEFVCVAAYITQAERGRRESRLVLHLSGDPVTIPMHAHLLEPSRSGGGQASAAFGGHFSIVS